MKTHKRSIFRLLCIIFGCLLIGCGVFVYQYDGEWYVYPEKMSAGVISYQAEF